MSESHSTVEYREVAGFPEYRVGNDGSLWSRWVRGHRRTRQAWQRIAGWANAHGYRVATLRATDGRKAERYIHMLVLEAFVGPCPEGMESCHEDDNPGNNALSNLRWDTHKANGLDAQRNARLPRGDTHHATKITEAKVHEARRRLAVGESQQSIADALEVSRGVIRHIADRTCWAWLKEEGQQ